MNRRQRYHRAAIDEMLHAAQVYNAERAGLGDELVDAIDAALNLAATEPVPGTTVLDNERPSLRRLLLERCPYEIVIQVDGEELKVVAVSHLKRRPHYWKTRVNE
jgi:hypothetical protein